METFGNEIKVQQGEDFNIDILLSSNQIEYIPYIISNKRKNPFFVVTVASTKYEKNLRYVCSWWNDILSGPNPIPTFYQTTPYNIGSYANKAALPTIPPVIGPGQAKETAETRLLYQYTLDDEDIDPETGHKPYHYYYFNYNADGQPTGRVDEYECRIRFNFRSDETAQWTGQNYMYQITLVSGELMADVLTGIASEHGNPADFPTEDDYPEDSDGLIEAQYRYIKIQWPDELQPDIDVTSPLGRIETPEVILAPTKLQVFNNLRQLI